MPTDEQRAAPLAASPSGRPRAAEWISLTLILALAAWLRLGWPGVNSFSFDEARVSHMALQMARDGRFAALGMQSSTGVPNFPAAVWLYALPFAVTPSPLLATLLTGLANVAAVLGIWWLARASWGRWAGLVAALLAASSPYLVYYSRSIWSQNLLVPLAVLWAVCAVVALQKPQRSWALAVHAFVAGFAGQVHIAGLALLLGSVWLGLRHRLWQRWRPVLLGAFAAGLAALPTIYTIARYGSGAKAELANLLGQPAQTHWKGFRQLLQLALNLDWERFWLGGKWTWEPPLSAALLTASVAAGLLVALGLITLLRAWKEPRPRPVLNSFVLVWALACPLFFLRSKTGANIHYQLASLPALLLLGGAAATLSCRRWWGPMLLLASLALAVPQSIAVVQTLNEVAAELHPGGMGTPLAYPQAAARWLQATGRPVVIETQGDNPAYDGDAAVFEVLLWDSPHQIVDARSTLLLPAARPATLFFLYESLPAWEVARDLNLGAASYQLPRRSNEPPYRALTVEDATLAADPWIPIEPVRLANGATLVGWQVELLDEDQLRLLTLWQLESDADGLAYQQFNHLYLAGETSPYEIHDVGTSSAAWQAGDQLITWADFAAPPAEVAAFQVGMYTWPDLERSAVLDRPGDPLTPIELALPAGALP